MAHRLEIPRLAILIEDLRKMEEQFELESQKVRNPRLSGKCAGIETRIRQIKSRIDQLGRKGELKVSIVKKKRWHKPRYDAQIQENGETSSLIIAGGFWEEFTEIMFWHDLDDGSISQLINNGVKDNEKLLEKTILPMPLGQKFNDPNNLFISWLKG